MSKTNFRFLTGNTVSTFESLKNIDVQTSNESKGFDANDTFLAFPLVGSGGRIGIWRTTETGRLPVKIPSVIFGCEIHDFCFDPFDSFKLLVSGDDGKLKLFSLKELTDQDMTDAAHSITAHASKAVLCRYHPMVSNMAASASPSEIKVWDLSGWKCLMTIPLSESIFDLSFYFHQLAFITKDRQIQIADTRTGQVTGKGPLYHDGPKAARVVWVDSEQLLTVGFAKGNSREFALYSANALEKGATSNTHIDVSPSILYPHYDADTKLLFLTGKGESLVLVYDVSHSQFVTKYSSTGPHLSIAFLPKTFVDVRKVEIVKGYRLTMNSIDRITFTLPRKQVEYFQDDIFIDTVDTTKPVWDSPGDFLRVSNYSVPRVSLHPPDMIALSKSPRPSSVRGQSNASREASEDEKKEASLKAMMEAALRVSDENLPQEQLEGVDESEWD